MSAGRGGRKDLLCGREVLLVDALGTLVALEPPAPRLSSGLRTRCGISISNCDAERAIAAEIAYYRAHLGEGRDVASLVGLRRRCAAAMRDALPAEARVDNLDTLVEVLLCSLEFSVFDDVRPALSFARERGVKVVVVSNWDVSLKDVLARLGLAPLLDGVVVSAAVGAAKPSPEIFSRALAVAGARAACAVHTGDSLREDVEGARGAGIEPILLRRDGGAGPPGVRTIESLAELAE